MLRFVIQSVLYAVALVWLIPALGIAVTTNGDFGTALGLAVAFSAVAWLVGKALQIITLATFGLAGCLLVFTWWLIPALCLHFTAQLFPASLSIASAWSAVFAGLVLMVMSVAATVLSGGSSSSR
jgi:uncharacterized membrane protein YvlD (DUF360 family)